MKGIIYQTRRFTRFEVESLLEKDKFEKISEEEFDNFSALGFDIAMTYNGKTYTNTYTTTTVYTSLMANGTPVSASEYGGTYFYAVEITGLDAATAGNVVFNVDGITIHAGETTTNVFGSGEYTYSAN